MSTLETFGDFTRVGDTLRIDTRYGRIKKMASIPVHTWAKTGQNARRAHALIYAGNDDPFRGGNHTDLMRVLDGKQDMSGFYKAFEEFKQSGLSKDLNTVLKPMKPIRKRVMSEHDGEWNYDSRWEMQPFSRTLKLLAPLRTLEIDAHFSVGASGGAKAIDKYGAIVWGITQLIEAAGIQVGIHWSDSATHTASGGLTYYGAVRLKAPGEYLAPQNIAGCFTTLFFRRLCFGMQVATCEAFGKECSEGMGCAVRRVPVAFEKGVLKLSPDCIRGCDDDLKQALITAIKGNNAA